MQNPGSDNLFDEILNLLEFSNKFNYRVWNGTLNQGVTGRTYSSGSDIITIIDSNYLNTATTISIVRTMMHEMIHAHIVHLNYGNPGADLFQSLVAFANSKGYTDLEVIHHEFMPVFIDVISQGLYQWDLAHNLGNVQPMQFYQDLAWGGLNGRLIDHVWTPYQAFLDNFPNVNDQNRINAVIVNEASDGSQAKGSPCTN